jgi:hypothetical protein
VSGITILSLTYVYDLILMLAPGAFGGREGAMAEMSRLHLNYNWYINLARIPVLVVGF